jgi:hypothetical protein
MNSFLLDAPIFITRFTAGPGYLLVDQLFAQASQGRLCCSVLTLAEVAADLVRLRRQRRLTAAFVDSARQQLWLDVIQPKHFTKLPLDNTQVETALDLIDQHKIDSMAGILVRVCLDHAASLRAAGHDLVLVSTGRRLLQVARKEGLVTFNPETQTQADLAALLGP